MEKYMMNVRSCCCGCTLKTGAIILLWFGFIGSIYQLCRYSGALIDINTTPGMDETVKVILSAICYYYLVHLVFLAFIPCALGLYGVYQRKPQYLQPYIFVTVFELVALLITAVFVLLVGTVSGNTIAALAKEAMKHQGQPDDDGVGTAVGLLVFGILLTIIIIGVIHWYFVSVVYRYYKQLKEEVQPYRGGADYSAPPRYEAPMKA